METTHTLKLPYIMAAQAQKHVTHNEALRMLDAIVQLSVLDKDLTLPPGSPSEGDRYIVSGSASGDWAGQGDAIAAWQDGAWAFYAPATGWRAWIEDEGTLFVFDGTEWIAAMTGGSASVNPTPLVGVNATADATNRLSVASDASLFNHDGSDHRQKINKASAGDTASQLYQSAFSGRAEIGLTGDDDFHFKVSPNGSTFYEAIEINKDNGNIGIKGATPESGEGAVSIDGGISLKRKSGAFGSSGAYLSLLIGQGQRGGLYAIGRDDPANNPFTALSGWDSGSSRLLYYGGGGWGVPDAMQHNFYTADTYDETNNAGVLRLYIKPDGTLRPGADNTYDLGEASGRWKEIFSVNGTINTSDIRDKTDVKPSALGLAFVQKLNPVSYKWRVGQNDVQAAAPDNTTTPGESNEVVTGKPGTRTHFGLIAQDVKKALDDEGCSDFAGWTLDAKDDQSSRQGLRYTELIAPLIKAVQELAETVSHLQGELRDLRGR